MPEVGFIDANGEKVTFEEVRAGKGVFVDPGGLAIPRAFLNVLASGYRSSDHYGDPDVVSVTTLIGPSQIARLKQRHEIWIDDPFDGLWATFGTIGHGMFEGGVMPTDVSEVRLMVEFEGTKIGGTFDLLELHAKAGKKKGGISTPAVYRGRDWKVTSSYSIQKMLEGELSWNGEKYDYWWQAQVYKWMIGRKDTQKFVRDSETEYHYEPWEHAGSQIEDWEIAAVCRNYSARNHKRVLGGPFRMIPVEPILESHRIENYLRERAAVWSLSEMCQDHQLPDCTAEENWGGRRCADWCSAAPFCHQKAGTKGLDGGLPVQ